MKRYLLTIIIALGCFYPVTILAQTQIKGTTIHVENHTPIQFVTVTLKKGTETVKTSLTAKDGTFIVKDVDSGTYALLFTSVDYLAKEISLRIPDTLQSSGIVQIGQIEMTAKTNTVKAVEITASRPLLKQEIDRISYDLQADPESKGANVLSMLRKVPYVSVDGNDDILVKGNSDYKIFINGKPSTMLDRDPKTILRSMPASSIDKIEVITSPSAKYDAEGIGGIINIVTRKSLANGYNGSVNLNGRFPVGGPGIGGSLAVKQNKLGISAFGGGSLSQSPQTTNSKWLQGAGASSLLTQDGIYSSRDRNGYGAGELSLEIDSLNLISSAFNFNAAHARSQSSLLSVTSNQGALQQKFRLSGNDVNARNGWDGTINYQKGFKNNKNHLLTFSYQYATFESDVDGNEVFSERVGYTDPNYIQANTGRYDEQTVQMDYVLPIKKINIEAGIKGIFRENSSNYLLSVEDPGMGIFIVDPNRSNIYTNDQGIYSAYNSYRFTLGKWGVRFGVRLEHTRVHANFVSSGALVNQTYTNVPLNILINRTFENRSSISFGIQQRIMRAGINKLNPFVDRSNPNFESAGNPNLVPALVNTANLEFSSFKKVSLNMGVQMNYSSNMIIPIDTYDPTTKITRSTFENVGKAMGIGMSVNVRYPISKVFNVSMNARSQYIHLNTFIKQTRATYDLIMFNAFSSADYRLKNNWRLNANINYSGPGVTTMQGRRNAFLGSSLGINKDILASKLNLSATVSNPFSKFRKSEVNTDDVNFTQKSVNYTYFRGFSLSVNYKFGKLKEEIKKSKRGIKNDDLSN